MPTRSAILCASIAASLLLVAFPAAALEGGQVEDEEVRPGRQLLNDCSGYEKVSVQKGAVGYLYAFIAILGFGSNFVPVKKVDAGDGVHFSAVMTTAIWLVGLIVQVARGHSAVFRPFAMLGGALWATGNVAVPVIVRCIGLGMGLLIWGLLNMVTGWSSGRFGLFGLDEQVPKHSGMNYAGVAIAVCAIFVYYFVETKDSTKEEPAESEVSDVLHGDDVRLGDPLLDDSKDTEGSDMQWLDNLPPVQKKALGFGLAMVAGLLYGTNFDPPQSLIDGHSCKDGDDVYMKDGYSHNSLDYVFSHFCGIFASTQIYFLIYCCLKKNKPFLLHSSAYLPAILSGFGWAIAQVSWFLANDALEIVISFPIVTTGPGVIGALWGIFLYGEIQGQRNLLILGVAILLSLTGVTLIALSK